MDNVLTQLGVGGCLVILVLKTVFDYLKRNERNGNGAKTVLCVGRPEFEKHKEAVQYKDNCEQIVKRIDQNFHERKQDMDKRFDKVENCLGELKMMVGKL
jgi:hypothetical protein